ncbi:MAG: hypothetical protein OXU79_11880 [Gemmatimonadota bacterium]|nr:hypothetical protein [Gemmatimonadota bacterium]
MLLQLPVKLDPLTKRQKRQLQKLPPQAIKNVEDVVKEFYEGELPPGRQLELVDGFDDVYAVRLNDSYRMAIQSDNKGTGRVILIDVHEKFYDRLNRMK